MNLLLNASMFGRAAGVVLAVFLLSGCVSRTPAPVRNGAGMPEAGTAAAPAARPGFHVVRPGDTLMGLSRLYGQNPKDLVLWNRLGDPNQIHVGQELRVAPPEGTIVQPVAIAQPVEVQPVAPNGAPPVPNGPVGTPIRLEPKGGKQPYSDAAWAAINPQAVQPAPPPAPAPADPGTLAEAEWLWPVSGKVIEGFNEATNKGVDIAGKPGDPVIAAAAGKVVYSGSGLRGYGKLVIIKHDANYLTAYAHNQQLLVKEGDSVTKGQRIAELGSTDADRPKLHFEIRKQGRPVDPLKYLPAR